MGNFVPSLSIKQEIIITIETNEMNKTRGLINSVTLCY